MQLEIQQFMIGAACVLKPTGALSESDAGSLRLAAEEAQRRHAGRVVLDASQIAFIDSAGLEALLDVTELLGHAGRSLKICNANATLRQSIQITGLSGAFEFYEEAHDAVRSFL
jgi:anti-sigma B factor antagonist